MHPAGPARSRRLLLQQQRWRGKVGLGHIGHAKAEGQAHDGEAQKAGKTTVDISGKNGSSDSESPDEI